MELRLFLGTLRLDAQEVVEVGEAKRRAADRMKRERYSKVLSPSRFNVYAMGTRLSASRIFAEELSYWASEDERVLGMVIRDVTDDDFGWMIFARDRVRRFRCVDVNMSITTKRAATSALRDRIARAVIEDRIDELGDQADEPNAPVDLLRVEPGADETKLHPFFQVLRSDPGRAPARAVMQELGPWLAPTDPHFINEFQFKQFDQRLWELYLWAAFRELGFDVTQPEAPDFLCSAPGIQFAVEATTVTASAAGPLAAHPNPQTPDEIRAFLAEYMPMKFGSSLTSKLNKRTASGAPYWERGDAADKPFILAIADFHKPGTVDEIGSMTYTHSALWPYLYGHRVDWEKVDGKLVVRAVKNQQHSFAGKTIPSGFFDLPGAENVSAVLFSNAGTLAKFDRMGVAAGWAPSDHRYFRAGLRYDPDPDAVVGLRFSEEVVAETHELWSDELQIFHNPNALRPIHESSFAGVIQHYFKDGDHYSITPVGSIIASRTLIVRFTGNDETRTMV